MGGAQTKSERTRQFIIESTAEIFNKKGFAGTSLTDLTEATQLTKGSIYGNFAGKEDVAIAAFDYNWDKIRNHVADKMRQYDSCHDKLMVYVSIYKNVGMETFSHGGCPVLNTAVEADDTNPILKEKASAAFESWKDNIAQLVKKGIASGEFRDDLNPQQAALTIVAMIEGGIMIVKLTDHPKYLTDIMHSLSAYIDTFIRS